MARFLKQSTAFTFRIGPFVDSTDGVTAETALSIAQADIQISKAGGAFAQTSATPTTTHDADGWYQCPLTATDTGTRGSLTVQIVMAGALPVWEHFMVLPANVYDSLVGGTDALQVDTIQVNGTAQTARDIGASVLLSSGTGTGQVTLTSGRVNADLTHIATAAVSASTAQLGVNVVNFGGSAGTFAAGVPAVNATQISGDSVAADNLENAFDDTAGPVPWFGIVDQGTAQSATSTTLVLRAAAAFADDTVIGCTVGVLGSTQGYWQFREIKDYVGSTDTATVDAWTVTPSGTITYKVFGGPPAPTTPPAVNVTQVIGDPIIASSSKTTNWGGTP